MFLRRVIRFATSNNIPTPKLPKAPRLLSGELQSFRFDAESARIYDGYTLDQLYGSKIGLKHSPAVLAQMRKDTIASLVVFILGFSIIYHLHKLDLQQLQEMSNLNQKRLSRTVKLPEGLSNNLKPTAFVLDDVQSL